MHSFPLGDIFSLHTGVDICNRVYHCGRGGIALCKPGGTCLEEVGKEINEIAPYIYTSVKIFRYSNLMFFMTLHSYKRFPK